MWDINDVDKHKKGLSDKQKKQWVRIANAALASCMKKGGTDEECAAKAIKQANGVVNANSGAYAVYKNRPESDYEVTLTVHQDKPCYVVPVVMMVEVRHWKSLTRSTRLMSLKDPIVGWDSVVIDHLKIMKRIFGQQPK